MRFFTAPLLFLMAGALCACASEEITGGTTPARDLTGTWVGTTPNGALYQDNAANPNCTYEADLEVQFAQDGQTLTGTLTLTVRESNGPLANPSLPCVPVGTQSVQALTGEVGSTRANFTLADGVTVFSGTFTTDLMSGDFVVNAINGVIGTFDIVRS